MHTETPPPPGAAAHPIMFWVLTCLALAVFAPCVLVPIVLESQEIRAYERVAAASVAELEAQVNKNDARIEALRTDPLVNERIVRRELNYRPEGEQVVHLPPELAQLRLGSGVVLPSSASETTEPDDWFVSAARWLPAWPWAELFAKPPNRTLLLVMAGGLLVAAFLLYGRTAPPLPAPARAD